MKIFESISIDLEAPVRFGFAAKGWHRFLCGVALGLGVLLAGCGGDEGVLDTDTDNPISFESQVRVSGVSAEQVVTGGIPQRQSRIHIPFIGDVSVNGCTACRFEARVHNPLTDLEELREIHIDSLVVDGSDPNVLIVLIAGPAPAGSVFGVSDSALSVGGQPVEAGSITFTGLALSPTEAALWFKAFVPTDAEMYPSAVYSGGPAQELPQQSTDPAMVFSELNNHFQNFLDLGLLTLNKVEELLLRFQDPQQQKVFTNAETDIFEPQLMAAVLALAGTPGEGALAAIIDGQNDTGLPAQVVYGDLLPGLLAGVDLVEENGRLRWKITFHPILRREPFQAVSALAGHEAIHQDEAQIGQNEEIVGKSIEVNVWKLQLLAMPHLAGLRTPLTRFLNFETLLHENSGRYFPKGGLFQAPGISDALPGSQLDPTDFDSFMRENIYSEIPKIETTGNALLDSYVSVSTGNDSQGLDFNRSVLETLDNPQFFTANEDFEVLKILTLNLRSLM